MRTGFGRKEAGIGLTSRAGGTADASLLSGFHSGPRRFAATWRLDDGALSIRLDASHGSRERIELEGAAFVLWMSPSVARVDTECIGHAAKLVRRLGTPYDAGDLQEELDKLRRLQSFR